MAYIFKNIIGTFALDEKLKFTSKKGQELLPVEKMPEVLQLFKDKKYFCEFHQKNLELTKKAVKESVSEDQLIIQAISNINELDRIINTLAKRLREWYSLYLPEISEEIQDHEMYAELIAGKSKPQLMKEIKAKETMGAELGKVHVEEMILLAQEVKNLFQLRKMHETYLKKVMEKYCPNLLELGGITIGAKLLELSRSLKHLALLPASTIQLLGAEKALFRHIKTGSRSPKHGIIINHPLIQKARKDDKGKAARMLADKLSLCARLDYFKGEFKAKEYKKELEGKLR